MFGFDENAILAISENAPLEHARSSEQFVGEQNSVGKHYTRIFSGYPLSAYDHPIVVYQKKNIIVKHWKDLGSGDAVFMQRAPLTIVESPHKGHSRLGFDLLYKIDEETGAAINIARVDAVVKEVAENLFGNSMSALVMPTYESSMHDEYVSSFLFGIALAHGKWQIKDNTLLPLKITLPLTSSLFGRRDLCEMLVEQMHRLHILHSVQFTKTASFDLMQLVIHDPELLGQFVLWMKPIVNIEKISTYEKRQKAYNVLIAYDDGVDLPQEQLLLLEMD